MSTRLRFHVREAETSLGDDEFVISAFDSALPYLASIGSHEMWGSTPFSERDGWAAETSQQIKDAETYRLTGQGEEALRVFIAEVEVPAEGEGPSSAAQEGRGPGSSVGVLEAAAADQRHELQARIRPEDGKHVLRVGFAFVRKDWVPQYVMSQAHLGLGDEDRKSCVYIEAMVTDHRVSSAFRKGCGAALLEEIIRYGKSIQRTVLFVDGWAGNDKKLIGSVPSPPLPIPTEFLKPAYERRKLNVPLQLLYTTRLPGDR